MYITRRERFSSAHRLYNPKMNSKNNAELFGKCYELHGHNYQLFVTVTGSLKKESGFVLDLKDLKKIIHTKIIDKLDHKVINDADFMKDKIASTENVCIAIWEELYEPIKNKLNCELFSVKILETENNIFEYFGNN